MIREQQSWQKNPCLPPKRQGGDTAERELDLDRLVWDPEYRRSVRHLIKRHD